MTRSSNIESIIERQARFWEVRERLVAEGGEAARRALAHLAEGPWITVSKQWGCGAAEVAQRLASDLHWQAFDKEILAAIAQHTSTLEKVLSRLDEHAIGSINDYLAQMLVPSDPGQARYLKEMIRVVWSLAREGNAIIVGRGANYFLQSRFGLRVRLTAPMDLRAARVAAETGCTDHDARQAIERHDAEQAAFIRQAFARDIDDPLGFDLVVNLGGLSLDAASQTIQAALHGKLQAG